MVIYDAGVHENFNDNLRMMTQEYWVDGYSFQQIRKPVSFMSFLDAYDCRKDSIKDRRTFIKIGSGENMSSQDSKSSRS